MKLDEDVLQQLSNIARRQGRSVSEVGNELLRLGLRVHDERGPLPPYEPTVFDTGPPLIDVTDVTEALERLDAT